ncbi:MAG TPA: hypothetical protein VMM93_02060 [Vicinamibacterales bacterium]|nr:hypothetical protein [Vicinamibacterales bacterium]
MVVRAFPSLALVACLVSAAACGPSVDLTTALEVVETSGGFYDNGQKDGKRHLLPTVSFRVQNKTDLELDSLQITVQFRRVGMEEDFDSKLLPHLSLAPGGQSDLNVIRAERGYTLEDPDLEELFGHSQFRDFTVRFFARRSGQIVQIGEYTIERRILTQTTAGRP